MWYDIHNTLFLCVPLPFFAGNCWLLLLLALLYISLSKVNLHKYTHKIYKKKKKSTETMNIRNYDKTRDPFHTQILNSQVLLSNHGKMLEHSGDSLVFSPSKNTSCDNIPQEWNTSFRICNITPRASHPFTYTSLWTAGVSGWISDSYCSIKPLCSGMGEVVLARTSSTLLPPSPRIVL